MVFAAQAALLPDLVLEEIFVRLPPRQFHQYRCLSRHWAAALSSDDAVNRHLHVHGKIRLDYDSLMQQLALGCCLTIGEPDNDIAELCDITEEEPFGDDDDDDDDDGASHVDGEERNWREEYRTRGYVEVDEDYYIQLAEMQAWLAELWAKEDFSGITFVDSDDEGLKAYTVPFGALHPRIRQPLMQEEAQQEEGSIMPNHGRVKTEEEVDQEIIAFLRRLRDTDPKSTFLKEFDTYGGAYEPRQE